MIRTWAPEDFWQAAQPLIPVPAPRPQGGGKGRADDRAVLAAIVYLVQAGCSWRKLPRHTVRGQPPDGAPPVHRVDPGWAVATAAPAVPAPAQRDQRDRLVPGDGRLDRRPGREKGDETGPNPVDHGKPGSKIHIICDRTGLPLTVLISAANTHDSQLMIPLLDSLAPAGQLDQTAESQDVGDRSVSGRR
jgi:transposase